MSALNGDVTAPSAPPEVALPQGWIIARDVVSEKIYYANPTTGETSWAPPTACDNHERKATMPPPRKRHKVTDQKDKTNATTLTEEEDEKAEPLNPSEDNKQQSPLPPPPPIIKTTTPTLFIGSLHPRVAEVHLEKLFSSYGKIKRLTIQTPKKTGNQNRSNFAFVEFSSIREAQAAMTAVHEKVLLGKTLIVKPANESEKDRSRRGGVKSSPLSRQQERKSVEDKIQALKRKLSER